MRCGHVVAVESDGPCACSWSGQRHAVSGAWAGVFLAEFRKSSEIDGVFGSSPAPPVPICTQDWTVRVTACCARGPR